MTWNASAATSQRGNQMTTAIRRLGVADLSPAAFEAAFWRDFYIGFLSKAPGNGYQTAVRHRLHRAVCPPICWQSADTDL